MPPELSHVDCWIFDLDLTLYTPEHGIMGQVRDRIAAYVEEFFGIGPEDAHRIRHDYWRRYGTTLDYARRTLETLGAHGIHDRRLRTLLSLVDDEEA